MANETIEAGQRVVLSQSILNVFLDHFSIEIAFLELANSTFYGTDSASIEDWGGAITPKLMS